MYKERDTANTAQTRVKKVNPIEQQKQQQKLVRDQIKAQKQQEKLGRQEEEDAQKRLLKDERLFAGSTSRRARQDARNERKKAEKAANGAQQCEHGIIKCRICNPLTAKINYRNGAAAPEAELD